MGPRKLAVVYGGLVVVLGVLLGVFRAVGTFLVTYVPPGADRILFETVLHLSPVVTAFDVATAILFPSLSTLVAVLILATHIAALNMLDNPFQGWQRYVFEAVRWLLGPVAVIPVAFWRTG